MAKKPEAEVAQKCARDGCDEPARPGSKFSSEHCRRLVAKEAGTDSTTFEAGIPCVQVD